MRCPSCDSPNPPDAVHCEECGANLTGKPVRRRPDAEGIEERPRRRRPDAEAAESPRPRRRRDEEDDEYERRPRRRRPRDRDTGDEVISTLIPYKNPSALASYYLGVFSLIPVIGLLLALLAWIFGVLGLRYVSRNPRAHGTGHAIAGIVLGLVSVLYHVAIVVWFNYQVNHPHR